MRPMASSFSSSTSASEMVVSLSHAASTVNAQAPGLSLGHAGSMYSYVSLWKRMREPSTSRDG